jgi:hypothetical protein
MQSTSTTISPLANHSCHSCHCCGKTYTRKTSYIKHVILCEVLHQTKREKKCEEEESTDIPSTKQLYNIIQELAIKYQNMEQKMNEMQKWVETKKRKLNVIQWLNINIEPSTSIQNWIQSIQVNEEHIEILIEENMFQTISAILRGRLKEDKKSSQTTSSASLSKPQETPIYCLTQKANLFYCYNDETNKWSHFTTEEIIIMLKRLHQKLVKALCEWHDNNISRINSSDKMQILYNQSMIKLMSVNFTQDSQILSKIKNDLYQQLKTDMKNVIEYEFEF